MARTPESLLSSWVNLHAITAKAVQNNRVPEFRMVFMEKVAIEDELRETHGLRVVKNGDTYSLSLSGEVKTYGGFTSISWDVDAPVGTSFSVDFSLPPKDPTESPNERDMQHE